jgi:molybdate-binding protein
LALLEGPLWRHVPSCGLLWRACSNSTGLKLVAKGAVHAAAVHRGAGEMVTRPGGLEVIGFAAWREGLVLSRELSGRVAGIEDALGLKLRLANREPGSEARRLLDRALETCGASGGEIPGYSSACTAHLLVASAIASGLADFGVASEPAALAYGLGFIPWQDEICELHVPRALLGTPPVRALLDVLAGQELPAQLAAIAGYDPTPCGRVMES